MSESLSSDKRIFDRWRIELVASMTLVDVLAEGKLYYYESPYSCNVWVVEGPHSVMVAYHGFEKDQEIRRKVRLWDQALEAGVSHKSSGEIRPPQYGAKEDSETKQLTVVWFNPGDWFGLTRRHPLPKEWNQLPRGWPESYRDRIVQFAAERAEHTEKTRRDA